VAEDSSNPFASILGALASKGDGDKSGVIKDNDGKVSPILTPSEISRYEKIFGVMKKIVNPGPETGQLDQTSTGKVGGVAAMAKAAKNKAEVGGAGPDLGTLALAGVAAGIIGAALLQMEEDFIAKIKGWGDGVVKFADESGDEFGKLGALAMKIAKFIPLKSLKMLPLIGSLINFYYAWDHFDKGEYFDGTWELISGIINFFPGGQFVSPLMDGYKIYAEIIANREEKETGKKPTFSDIIGRQLKALGGWLMTKIAEGKVPLLSTFYMIGEGLGMMFTGDTLGGIEKLLLSFPALLGQGYNDSPLMRGCEWLYELMFEEDSEAREAGSRMAGGAWGWLEEAFSGIGEIIYSFWESITDWIDNTIQKGKDLVWDLIPDALKPNIPSQEERGFGDEDFQQRSKEQFKGAKAYQRWRDKNDPGGDEAYTSGEAALMAKGFNETDQEMIDFYAEEAKKDAILRQRFEDYRDGVTQNEAGGYGNYDIMPPPSIKDGIVHQNGRATRIDGGDSGIFAKKGGPIDKMLDQNSEVMKTIQGINKKQLDVLIEIRDGILSLSQPPSEPSFNNAPLTQEFFS
jgi:hypothetical protein